MTRVCSLPSTTTVKRHPFLVLGSDIGSPELPVVFLGVQMRADPGFQHRLAALTFRFLQLHPAIEPWRLFLGPVTPLRAFMEAVHWVSLDALGQQEHLDAAIDMLTLPIRPEPELGEGCRRILAVRMDLEPVVLSRPLSVSHTSAVSRSS
jgi:hypothetical protein